MKLFIASDIHGSKYYAEKIKEMYNQENSDKIILLGDLYYHGPRNPLTNEYEPMEVAKILNSLKDNMLVVKGNCDAEVDEMISEFSFQDKIILEVNGLKIFFTHGHKYNMNALPKEEIDMLIYGHFHTGFIKKEKGIIFANAGSVSLPKNGTRNSYLIIDEQEILLKDINNGEIIEKMELK